MRLRQNTQNTSNLMAMASNLVAMTCQIERQDRQTKPYILITFIVSTSFLLLIVRHLLLEAMHLLLVANIVSNSSSTWTRVQTSPELGEAILQGGSWPHVDPRRSFFWTCGGERRIESGDIRLHEHGPPFVSERFGRGWMFCNFHFSHIPFHIGRFAFDFHFSLAT